MPRQTFIFYRDWLNALKDMPDNIRLEMYDSITSYALDGEIPELSPLAKVAFSFVKPQIDRDIDKYNKVVERNRANGKLGGRKPKRTQNNPKNPLGFLATQKTQVNPKNLDNDNDNDKENSNTPNVVLEKKKAAEAATLSRKEKFGQSLIPYVEKYGKEMIRDFFDYWSEFNKSKSKMRFEQQPTWETSKRLATWAKRERNYAKDTGGHEDKRRGYAVMPDVEKDYNSTF